MKYAFVSIFIGSSFLSPALSAEFSGIPVTMSVIPNEIIKPIPIQITTDQFKARLKQGGTLTLDGTSLTLGPPDPNKRSVAFMALDRLELKNGAKIITNGNVLSLFVNSIESQNGSILSFEGSSNKGTDGPVSSGIGAGGNAGTAGIGGGVVSLHVIDKIDGLINVDIHGQNGGTGSDGQTGGTPPQAGRGVDAQDGPGGWLTPGWCKRGGGDGEPGNQGYQGGAAGGGGRGGDGGYFELVNVGPEPVASAAYTFSAQGGTAGSPGKPGLGGAGGRGGDGGNGSTWCSGGRGGPNGTQGPPGPIPLPAQNGTPGNSLVKNLDIEVVVRTSIIPQQSQ